MLMEEAEEMSLPLIVNTTPFLNNFSWILDEQMSNSFSLSSVDETLDIKLLQLLRIFDKSLSAALFGEIAWGG